MAGLVWLDLLEGPQLFLGCSGSHTTTRWLDWIGLDWIGTGPIAFALVFMLPNTIEAKPKFITVVLVAIWVTVVLTVRRIESNLSLSLCFVPSSFGAHLHECWTCHRE